MPTEDPEIKDWGTKQPIDHLRLNAAQHKAITAITVGPGLLMGRKGNHVALRLAEQPFVKTRFMRVKITSNLWVGMYNAKSFDGAITPGAGNLVAGALGTLSDKDDVIVWEPSSAGLTDPLPLTGLITFGRVIGTDSENSDSVKPIVEIPPPGIRDIRYEGTTKVLQVAYISNPTEDDWVDKITFTAC